MLLIDGYNLLFAMVRGDHARFDVDVEREHLISLLQRYKRKKGACIVAVFDGNHFTQSMLIGDSTVRDGIKIIFTRSGESADDRIVEIVAKERDRKGIKVVTSDRAIVNAVEKLGSQTVSSQSFGAQLYRELDEPVCENPRDPKASGISPAEAKSWLKKFGIDEPRE